MNRITAKDLEHLCDRLNRKTGNPLKPWQTDDTGKMTANIGNYHISQAYGGFALMRMATEGGGITMPTNSSHITKRELCHQLDGFIAALRAMQ